MPLKEKGKVALAKASNIASQDAELAERYQLREPKSPTEFEQFEIELDADQRPFAELLWQMGCVHKDEVVMQDSSFVSGNAPTHVRCERCGSMRSWQGNAASTRRQEWRSYCPDGFDMFDWEDLYQRDKELWPLIFDEVQFAMLDTTMTDKED